MQFFHISGASNPADFATRATSARSLMKTNFHSGPPINEGSVLKFRVPDILNECDKLCMTVSVDYTADIVLPLYKYSNLNKLCRIVHYVMKFIHKLKMSINPDVNSKELSLKR